MPTQYPRSAPWRVSFSWEEEPGISKKSVSGQPCHQATVQGQTAGVNKVLCRLPPPPPCAIVQPKDSINNSIMRKKITAGCRGEDPFLVALRDQCTEGDHCSGDRHPKGAKKLVEGNWCPPPRRSSRLLSLGMPEFLSCKQSCDVRDDIMVRRQSYSGGDQHLRPFCGPRNNGRRISAGTIIRTSVSKGTQKRHGRISQL